MRNFFIKKRTPLWTNAAKKSILKCMTESLNIFVTFAKIGGLTFGGGYSMLPLLRRECVEGRGWITEEDLLDYYAIGQTTPGIIAVNTSLLIGYKVKRLKGALMAAFGVVFPSLVVILVIAAALAGYMGHPLVAHAFAGIRVVVAAMIVSAMLRQWRGAVKDWACGVIFAAALAALLFTRVSPVAIVLTSAAAGIAITFIKRKNKT